MRSDPRLKRIFREFNKRWFGGKLDDKTIVRWSTKDDEEDDKEARHMWGWSWAQHDPPEIVLNSERLRLTRSYTVMRFTLLHEMAHVATWFEKDEHGPVWEAFMLQLAARGAFSAKYNGGVPIW